MSGATAIATPKVDETNLPSYRSTRKPQPRLNLVTWIVAALAVLAVSGCDLGGQATRTATVAPQAATTAPTPAAEATMAATVTEATQGPQATEAAAANTPAPTAISGAASGTTFTNPVLRNDFADPFVLEEGGVYYAYATNASGKNVQVSSSTDLVKWKLPTEAMPAIGTWAQFGGSLVWAPEVMKIGEKFVLYYTARDKASDRQCVGVAVADKPQGRFQDTNEGPLVCQAEEGGTIDAAPFRDGDKLYLYYKNDGNCCNKLTYLYAQEMAPDGLSLVGEPKRLVHNDKGWEGRVVEAPTMWKHEDKYYLFFSANNYAGVEYAVGYANCETPLGPCEDAPENPILASRMDKTPLVVGPGHQTIIEDDDGETWLVYHAWEVTSAGMRGSSRFMWIDRLTFEGGKPVVQGPTTDPQPVP
ncbi:MAG: glycoside hydrolase family 43 protein [Chloroflexota bacterium]|nr:glycoside hydrolase family 43 protein [Chloroflexota bacterium]MDQ5865902.1 glycoside hydrolase family 43 protein [Chloroflexota bacterium]